MKARRSAAPVRTPKNHECGLEITQQRRDVKNEDRTGYVHENKGDNDKMSSEKHGFYTKMHELHANWQQSVRLIGRKCTQVARKIGAKADAESAHRPDEESSDE